MTPKIEVLRSLILLFCCISIVCFWNGKSPTNAQTSEDQNEHVSILRKNINPNQITMTSFIYNPNKDIPEWVHRIFGTKSVHHSSNTVYRIHHLVIHSIVEEEILNSTRIINTKINRDNISNFPPVCSFEMLGSSILDEADPIKSTYKVKGPSIGNASLTIPILNLDIHCYYRALYETWRPEIERTKPNYWSTFFYCPIYVSAICNQLNKHVNQSNQNLEFQVSMKLLEKAWYNSFSAPLKQPKRVFYPKDIVNTTNNFPLGICTAIPYTSTDNEKYHANGVMLQEWIRYYNKLGIKTFIYDRDGGHQKYVAEVIEESPALKENTAYYANTMRGILDPSTKGLKYDNNEMLGDLKIKEKFSRNVLGRFGVQGYDKTQTLTHCRFEAKAVYGLENIIVADYDEFIFCPKTGLSGKEQAKRVKHFVSEAVHQGSDQVTFIQRILYNMTTNIRNCVVEKAHAKLSIFDCYGPYKYAIAAHAIKSIHVGHSCPLTGYHQSCPSDHNVRNYDCMCKTQYYRDFNCAFVHLSTNKNTFDKPKATYHGEELDYIMKVKNEILTILTRTDE